MSNTEPHTVLRQAAYGDAAKYYDRLTPTLEADGQIHLGPEDGRVLAAVNARGIWQKIANMPEDGDVDHMMRSMVRPPTHLRMFGVRLMATEARLIWEVDGAKEPGTKYVGHVRYPWIQVISFRPKQGFAYDPSLTLDFLQPFPVRSQGDWIHTVEFMFDKMFHPGPLAHALAQQIARHHLTYGAPDGARPALERLALSGPLPDPPKGDTTDYFMPAHAEFPGGVDYIADGTIGSEWTVA